MGVPIASYRLPSGDVDGLQTELARHGVLSSIRANTGERVELQTRLAVTGVDDTLELDRLRAIVQAVFRRKQVHFDLVSQGFDGGTRVVWGDPRREG
jgi:hypothetical protein